MPGITEAAQLVLGSGVLTGAIAYAIQKVPLALVEYRKKRLELEEARKKIAVEKDKAEAETKRLDAEKDRNWEENTGKIYRDQRKDLEAARKAEHDCEERVAKLDAECRERDAKNQAELASHKTRLEVQEREINGVRAALKLHQAALEKLDRRLSQT